MKYRGVIEFHSTKLRTATAPGWTSEPAPPGKVRTAEWHTPPGMIDSQIYYERCAFSDDKWRRFDVCGGNVYIFPERNLLEKRSASSSALNSMSLFAIMPCSIVRGVTYHQRLLFTPKEDKSASFPRIIHSRIHLLAE